MGRRRRKKFKQFKQLNQFKVKLNPIVIWIGSFLLIALALFGSLGYAIYTSDLFKVELANIGSNVQLGPEINKLIQGRQLFSLDIGQIAATILKKNPEYKQVAVLKRFPSSLIVKVTKRVAYAQIKGRKFFPLDKEGVIISEGSKTSLDGLIVIETDRDPRIFRKGYRVRSKDLAYAFELISDLSESKSFNLFGVSTINATEAEALYFMINLDSAFGGNFNSRKKIRVIIGKNDFPRKISLLEEVIKTKFKDKLNLIQYIDLRYKEVYVGLDR